eukprot:403364126
MKTHFIDNIPKIIKKKEKHLIDSLRKKILEDQSSYKQFEGVIKDNGSFTQKMEALKHLNQEFEMQEFKKQMVEQTTQKIQQINTLGIKIEEINHDMEQSIAIFMADSEQTSIENKQPGNKIQNMLESWEAEIKNKCWSKDELENYAGELWLTADQFEKDLQDDVKGFDLEKQMIIKFYRQRIDQQKLKTGMFIEALETALTETKIYLGNELEQAQMTINDYESKIFNDLVIEDEIQNYLDKQENLKLSSLQEAQERFGQNLKIMKSMKGQLDQLKKELQREVNQKVIYEQQKDAYHGIVSYLNQGIIDMSNSLIGILESLKLTDSGIIYDLKQQKTLKENDEWLDSQQISLIIDTLQNLNLTQKCENIQTQQKQQETRNQKVLNFLTEIRTSAQNSAKFELNDNQKKLLREILGSFEDHVQKRLTLSIDKNLLDPGIRGITKGQSIMNFKNVAKKGGKIGNKGKNQPQSPSSIRHIKMKHFESEINKFSKKEQSKDFSQDIQEICQKLLSNHNLNFKLQGLQLTQILNLDQLMMCINKYIQTLDDETNDTRFQDTLYIEEYLQQLQFTPMKLLLFQNQKDKMLDILTRQIALSELFYQKEKFRIFPMGSSQETQTEEVNHYDFLKYKLNENNQQLNSQYQSISDIFTSSLNKYQDTQQFMKYLFYKLEKEQGNKSPKSKNQSPLVSPLKKQSTKDLDLSRRRLTIKPVKAKEENDNKGSSKNLHLSLQNSSPNRKQSSFNFQENNPLNHRSIDKQLLHLQPVSESQSPSEEKTGCKNMSGQNNGNIGFFKLNQILDESINSHGVSEFTHEESDSEITDTFDQADKSQQPATQLKEPKYTSKKDQIQKSINDLQLKEILEREIDKNQSSKEQMKQKNIMKNRQFINQKGKLIGGVNKNYRGQMIDEGVNTNIQMRDLDIILEIKKEAKFTINALEKLLEEQYKINAVQAKVINGKSQTNLISTASDTNNETEDEIFKGYGNEGLQPKSYWKNGNSFPYRSSNKFHPNTGRNLLKGRANRIAQQTQELTLLQQSMDDEQNANSSIKKQPQLLELNYNLKQNQQSSIFEKRRDLQRRKLFSQEFIKNTQDKMVRFQVQNQHHNSSQRDLQMNKSFEDSVQIGNSINISIEQKGLQYPNDMLPNILDFQEGHKLNKIDSLHKRSFKTFDSSQSHSQKNSPRSLLFKKQFNNSHQQINQIKLQQGLLNKDIKSLIGNLL